MRKNALRLLLAALLVVAVIVPATMAGAQITFISEDCGDGWMGEFGFGADEILLPNAQSGVDAMGRTTWTAPAGAAAIEVWIDVGWLAGSKVALTNGNDYFCGTSGRDVVDGKRGDDDLEGMGGNDKLHGGPGYDAGPGGWGAAVSDVAKACKGLKNAHAGC